MIDIHSHIIPCIDDGSKDVDMTLEMLAMASKSGTKNIIATPHYFKGYWTPHYKEVVAEVEKLNELAKNNSINIEIHPAQEVYFYDNMAEEFVEGKIGTINGSKYMLIEFPMDSFDKNIFDVLYELQIRGVTPVIAHPERYKAFINNPSEINKFIEEGYLFQLNGSSVTGLFGKDVKKTAETFLANRIYSFIGSDAHTTGKRNTHLSDALEAIDRLKPGTTDMFHENGVKLLNNEDVEFRGKKIEKKKGFFSFFKK